jgi:UDP-N-acetyl-D-glucosamine dehydrogenase
MPGYVVDRVSAALNTNKKAINGARVHVFGIAYKKDVSDMRESPALDIIDLLRRRGAIISYTDPHVPELSEGELDLESVAETAVGEGVDCAVICTDHRAFDYQRLARTFPVIVDTRNALRGFAGGHIFRL